MTKRSLFAFGHDIRKFTLQLNLVLRYYFDPYCLYFLFLKYLTISALKMLILCHSIALYFWLLHR